MTSHPNAKNTTHGTSTSKVYGLFIVQSFYLHRSKRRAFSALKEHLSYNPYVSASNAEVREMLLTTYNTLQQQAEANKPVYKTSNIPARVSANVFKANSTITTPMK